MNNNYFDMNIYFDLIENKIKKILLRKESTNITFDLLDTNKTKNNKLIALKEKQRQMKIGEIWQEVLGNYNGFYNLVKGNKYGLDIISPSKKIIIELKNRTNTDNSSSKKYNLSKLVNFKKNNPEYKCIYATINDNNKLKTLKGNIKIIKYDDIIIEHYIGYEILKLIFDDKIDIIIDFIKNTIDKYI